MGHCSLGDSMRLVLQIAAGVFLGNLVLALLAWGTLTFTLMQAQRTAEQQDLTRRIQEMTDQRHAREAEEAARTLRARK
jgi:hypothetical protein